MLFLSVWTHMQTLGRAPWEVWQVSFHQQPRAMWPATCLFISSSLSQEFRLATELDTVEVSQGQGSSKNNSQLAPCSPLHTGCSTVNTEFPHLAPRMWGSVPEIQIPGKKVWCSLQRGVWNLGGKKRSFYSLILSRVVLIQSWLPSVNMLFRFVRRRAIITIFFKFVYLFIYQLCWVFTAVWAFSSCGEQKLLSDCDAWASHCSGFSCCRAWSLGCSGLSSFGTWAQYLRLPGSRAQSQKLWRLALCSVACGIFPDQRSNLCLLHW